MDITTHPQRTSSTSRILALARDRGVFRLQDAREAGIHPEQIRRLRQRGILDRVARGTYRLAEADGSEHQTLAEACARVPNGIICLVSSLRFHGLTTQSPFEVWLAVAPNARTPKPGTVPLRIVRFSGEARESGVEFHRTPSGEVRVYSVAKTIADCFKFRNKIGIDVAIEALRDGWRSRRFTMDDLWRFGKICRVNNVMRPYLQTLS